MKKHPGQRSGWHRCAWDAFSCLSSAPSSWPRAGWAAVLALVMSGLIPMAGAQTTILWEGFEAAFPGEWSVGSSGAGPTWQDVHAAFGNEGAHGGYWKGYCAGTAYPLGSSEPNPEYTNDMVAFLARPIDLTGYTSATLSFWYKIPSLETCCDFCRVYLDGIDPALLWINAGEQPSWTQVVIDLSAHVGTIPTLRFEFWSDYSVTAEGWYLDDIEVTAIPPSVAAARNGENLVFSWPTTPPGFSLYSSPGLLPASWNPVSEPVVMAGDQHTVTTVPTGAGGCYSLSREPFFVPTMEAAEIARGHAETVWPADTMARGEPIPVADIDGAPFAYVLPFVRDAGAFPSEESILETVAALKDPYGPFPPDAPEILPPEFYAELEAVMGEMRFVLVSATKANYPVLLAQTSLHPYYLFQDSARVRAMSVLGAGAVDLEGFLMPSPDAEYFAFSAGGNWAFIHARTLEPLTPQEFSALLPCRVPPELAADRDLAWDEVLLAHRGAGAGGNQLTKITHAHLIPVVDWTYWCVPTAFTMATCFYDHYASSQKVLGFGRIVDYWFENSTGHNVPNFIDEMIDPSLTPPSWRTGGILNVLNSPSWNGYNFSLQSTAGNAGNDWAWAGLVSEINANRPAVWSTQPTNNTSGHAMTAFGYRVVSGQRFVIVYNTWGTTVKQQYAEYNYNQWVGGGAAAGTGYSQLLSGGQENSEDGILLSPRGGEIISSASQIQWQIVGSTIRTTDLYDSTDAGQTWTHRATVSTPTAGIYTDPWTPPGVSKKGRVRIRCLNAAAQLVAGDGSVQNVEFQVRPDLEPVETAFGYCSRTNGDLVVTVRNNGPANAGASTTEVSFSTGSGPQAVQLPTPAIPAGSTVEVIYTMPGACWDPDCNFQITVDALNQLDETNEGNNTVTGICLG